MIDCRAVGEDGSAGNRVLLVCVNRARREALALALEGAGWRVEASSSGVGGLLALREARPPFDWLVCDLAMPGLIDGRRLGYEFCFQRPLRSALFLGLADGDAVPPEGVAVSGSDDPARVTEALARLRREHVKLLQEI